MGRDCGSTFVNIKEVIPHDLIKFINGLQKGFKLRHYPEAGVKQSTALEIGNEHECSRQIHGLGDCKKWQQQ